MFKGSDAFNDGKGNSVKQYLETVGGMMNATTSLDRTNYFAVVGKEFLDHEVQVWQALCAVLDTAELGAGHWRARKGTTP